MRAAFEAWLLDTHLLTSEWQESRNCFKDYPAHLAFKAWQAATAAEQDRCAKIADNEAFRWVNACSDSRLGYAGEEACMEIGKNIRGRWYRQKPRD